VERRAASSVGTGPKVCWKSSLRDICQAVQHEVPRADLNDKARAAAATTGMGHHSDGVRRSAGCAVDMGLGMGMCMGLGMPSVFCLLSPACSDRLPSTLGSVWQPMAAGQGQAVSESVRQGPSHKSSTDWHWHGTQAPDAAFDRVKRER
jgi:hypothetical protein